MSDDDIGGTDISAADERALRSMFAALVEDAEPSELSALQVQRQASAEQRSARDRRTKRIGFTRNTLIAAVVIGVMALVAPRLLTSSGSTAASASSSSAAAVSGPDATSAAAGSAAASYAAAPAPAGVATAADGSSAAGSAAAGGAASSGSVAAGSSAAAAAAGGESSAPGIASDGSTASASSASSGAASSGAVSAPASSAAAASSSATGRCLPLPTRALADVRAALPGYRGAIRITSCSTQTSTQSAPGTATFAVSRTGPASCGAAASPCPTPTGSRIPGTTYAYAVPGGIVVAGPRGLTVTATATAGGPDRQALIAGARALLKILG